MTRSKKTRKRDDQASTLEPASKKTKLSPESDNVKSKPQSKDMGAAVSTVSFPPKDQDEKSASKPTPVESKKSRKRAADFLSDDEDDTPEVSTSKTKQPGQASRDKEAGKKARSKKRRDNKKARMDLEKKEAALSLTADGVNGVVEKKNSSSNKIKSAKKPAAKSMLAEAQNTVEQEIKDDWTDSSHKDKKRSKVTKPSKADADDNDEDEDVDPDLLVAIGEDVDETDIPDLNWDNDENRVSIPLDQKGKKALKKVKKNAKPDDGPGVIYVGRLPHGFEEKGLGGYFGQFGDTTRLRVSRNKRTGASKHFAFIEFASAEVANIAAQTMDGYLMYGHILKCKVVPKEQLEKMGDSLWKGANKKFRKIPHDKIEREKLAAPKSVNEWREKSEREQKKRDKRAKKAKEVMGYEMKEVKLKDPQEAADRVKFLKDIAVKEAETPVAAIEDAKKEVPIAQNDDESLSSDDENDDSASKQLLSGLETPQQGAPITNGTKKYDDADSSSDSESEAEDVVANLKALRDAAPVSPAKLNTAHQLPKKPSGGKNEIKATDASSTALTTDLNVDTDNENSKFKKKMSKAEQKSKKAKEDVPTDADGTPKKKEKYVPPTHKKLLAKAKYAKEHPEEHKAKKLEQRREEQRQRWEKKEKRRERQFENREEKRAQKANDAKAARSEDKGRVAIGSGGVEVKGSGKKITFD